MSQTQLQGNVGVVEVYWSVVQGRWGGVAGSVGQQCGDGGRELGTWNSSLPCHSTHSRPPSTLKRCVRYALFYT